MALILAQNQKTQSPYFQDLVPGYFSKIFAKWRDAYWKEGTELSGELIIHLYWCHYSWNLKKCK